MISDSLARGIVIRALDKTCARESGDEARNCLINTFLPTSFRITFYVRSIACNCKTSNDRSPANFT